MLVGSIDDLTKLNNRPSSMLGLEVCQPVFPEGFPDKGLCRESCIIVGPAAGNPTFRIKAHPFDTIRRTPRERQDRNNREAQEQNYGIFPEYFDFSVGSFFVTGGLG